MVVVVFGGLILVFLVHYLELYISVFAVLPPLNANREYYAYIESLREHFVLCTFVPAPPAAYSESPLISRTLIISSIYCIYIYIFPPDTFGAVARRVNLYALYGFKSLFLTCDQSEKKHI